MNEECPKWKQNAHVHTHTTHQSYSLQTLIHISHLWLDECVKNKTFQRVKQFFRYTNKFPIVFFFVCCLKPNGNHIHFTPFYMRISLMILFFNFRFYVVCDTVRLPKIKYFTNSFLPLSISLSIPISCKSWTSAWTSSAFVPICACISNALCVRVYCYTYACVCLS